MSDPTAGISPDALAHLRGESKQALTIAVVSVFTALGFITVLLRFYTRFIILRNQGLEDYLIGGAIVFSISMGCFMIKQTQAGTGLHAIFLDAAHITRMLQMLFGSITSYFISLTFTKISILVQYQRIFVGQRMRLAVYISIGVIFVYGIYTVLTTVFTCVPVTAYWDLTITNAKCLPKFPLWYGNAALNVATEIMIATLPIPTLLKLKMSSRQRYGLVVVFGLGYGACLVSVMRIYGLIVMEKHMDDSSYYSPEPAYWSAVEVSLGIMCACLPTIRPLLARVFPSLSSGSNGATSSNGNPNTFRMGRTSLHGKQDEISGIKITLTTQHEASWDPEPPAEKPDLTKPNFD